MTDNRPYYVAYDQRFEYVRGLPAAYTKLAEFLGSTVKEIRQLRKQHNCAGLIMRVGREEARAAGLWNA
jgi:hypothetical protein